VPVVTAPWVWQGVYPPIVAGVFGADASPDPAPAAVASLFLALVDADGFDQSAALDLVVPGDRLLFTSAADATRWVEYAATGDAVGTATDYTVPVTWVGGSPLPPSWALGTRFDTTVTASDPPVPVVLYATAEELAAALRLGPVTEANRALLESCIASAQREIDHDLDRVDPMPDPVPAIVNRTCVSRAVEWFKASDAAYGIVGLDEIGPLRIPKDGFARHAAAITSEKQRWGIA
jgi:hypothetical protein